MKALNLYYRWIRVPVSFYHRWYRDSLCLCTRLGAQGGSFGHLEGPIFGKGWLLLTPEMLDDFESHCTRL